MATTTFLGSAWTTTAGNKTVTATPAVGDLIVVITGATGVTTASVTDNNSSGVYTQVDSTRTGFSTTGNLQAWVRTTKVGAASSTIFTASQASSTGGGLVVLSVSGMSLTGASAVRSNGGQSTGTSGTTPAPVLSLTPLSSNPIITMVANGTNGSTTVTQRTGYTEDFDNGYNTPATGLEVSHLDSGETSATITFGSTTASAFASIALELSAAPNVSDSSAVSDTPTITVSAPQVSVSDSTVVTDLPYYIDDQPIIQEQVTISVITSAGFNPSVSDSTAIGETVTLSLTSYVNVSDSSAVSDTLTIELFSYINVSDSSAVSDTITPEVISSINVSDSSALSDTITVSPTSYVNVTDSSAIGDTITLYETTYFLSVTDSTAIGESVALSLQSYVNVTDSTAVADTEMVAIANTILEDNRQLIPQLVLV